MKYQLGHIMAILISWFTGSELNVAFVGKKVVMGEVRIWIERKKRKKIYSLPKRHTGTEEIYSIKRLLSQGWSEVELLLKIVFSFVISIQYIMLQNMSWNSNVNFYWLSNSNYNKQKA